MNKIYKVIWSKTKQCYVAVSEMAKRNGKSGSPVQKEETRRGGTPVRDGVCVAGGVVSTTGGHSYSYNICRGRCAAILAALGYPFGYHNQHGRSAAVLALAVSLWLAGGSVAGATGPAKIYIKANGSVNIDSTLQGKPCVGTMTANGTTLNIGETWTSPNPYDNYYTGYDIFAGNASNMIGHNTGYTLNVNGATFNSVGNLKMYGAWYGSNLTNNAVVITNSQFIGAASIYGANSDYDGTVSGSTVTVAGILGEDSKPKTSFSGGNQYIYAGYCNSASFSEKTIINNAVNLYGAAAMESVTLYGASANNFNGLTRNNNELHLGGTKSGAAVNGVALSPWQGYELDSTTVNNTVKAVNNFDKIVLHQVNWSTTTPALKATNGFTNFGHALDISGMTFANDTTAGTMTLLEGAASNFSTMNLTYSGGTAALDGTITSQLVKTEANKTSADKGVTLTYDATHTVSIADTSKVTYTVANSAIKNVALGEMSWGTGRTLTAGDFAFNADTAIDATGLEFSFADDAAKTNLAAGQSMMFLANATGLPAGQAVTYKDGAAAHTQTVALDAANGAALSGTLTGTVSTVAGAVKYEANGMTLDSVNLAGWDGATSAAVPASWKANASGVTIATDGMNAPELAPGKHVDIIQGDTDHYFANATIKGENAYKASAFEETDSGITFTGTQSKGVTLNTEKKHIIYAAGTKDVTKAALAGDVAWNSGKAYYENKQYTFTDSSKTDISGVRFTSVTDPLNQSMTLIKADSAAHAVKGNLEGSPDFTVSLSNTTLSAKATGTAAISGNDLTYTVNTVTLDSVSVAGVGSDAVPADWACAAEVKVDTDGMCVPTDVTFEKPQVILTAGSAVFDDNTITGSNKFGRQQNTVNETDTVQSVVKLTGTQDKGVKASEDKKSLVYAVGAKDVKNIELGAVSWSGGVTLLDAGKEEYNFAAVTSLGGSFDVTNPETVAAGESMTLLKANETLKDMATVEKEKSYSNSPVTGVTMDATLTGNLAAKGGAVTFTAAKNKANTLTFGDVEWKDSGALIDHRTTLSNVSFDGAAVDTTKINFTNKESLDANQQMTLVSDFGGKPGTITGSKYKVGTAYEGEGSASMEGDNLVFKTKTGAGNNGSGGNGSGEALKVSDETHTTVMSMEAGVALLAAGNEHIGAVAEGLGNAANMGADGTATAASVGGDSSRYETGSHVSTHNWNAAVAVGRKRELKNGELEYGLFGEYGKSSYTLHSDDGRGDGDSHYAGGGLLAKWTNKHDVYTEASFRMGRMSDSARNILHDGAGNAYGYNVHANYYGGHVGVGKVFRYNGGKSLDVYGKYYYNRRNGVNFTAGVDRYSLDAVASSVVRIGARYGTTDKKWNAYGGLAYEYEMDGKSAGTVNGAAIRAASVKGGSVRGEIGVRMEATKTNPWKADISIYGYGGRHRGFGGNISVAYMF